MTCPVQARADKLLSNQAFLAVLRAVDDVAGEHGMEALLRQANLPQYIHNYPPANAEPGGHRAIYVTQIAQAVATLYGARGYRAILHRIGASQAKHTLEQNSAVATATQIAFKLLPARVKVRKTLDIVSKGVNEQMDRATQIREDGDALIYADPTCIYCIDVHSDKPLCYSVVGFLHGFVEWALGSQDFKIEETTCQARGDPACNFRIALT